MKLSISYPVLDTDTEETLNNKEYEALVTLFDELVQAGYVLRSEGYDFINGGFVKKVNLSLLLPEDDDTVIIITAELVDEVNEPISKGCTSCSN